MGLGAKRVVKGALTPALGGILRKLPVVEPRSERCCYRLGLLGTVVVSEAEVCETEVLGEHPTLPRVNRANEAIDAWQGICGLAAESGDGAIARAARRRDRRDEGLEVGEGGEGKDGEPALGGFAIVHPPESLGIKRTEESPVENDRRGMVAVLENPFQVVQV